ncbi:unnamed protein product [Gemmata massiliana]|uniref:Uncharacterized protein n=1 Tax=Gemmata massiliana TaxID=1210884 RepID=A0A6P2CVI5_9BACT|nr:phage tail assembly chaperone family protein, TAC [Gemmata massiliana]VTR92165.1 unnamed protein product [Gemmata massiliana]
MTKADAIAALKKKPVAVTVGDVTVFVKPLTIAGKEQFAAWRQGNPNAGVVAPLLAASLCDDTGALLFAGPEEVADLDADLSDKVCNTILDINGMRAPDAPE